MKIALTVFVLLLVMTGCGGGGGSSDGTNVSYTVTLRTVDKFNEQASSFAQRDPIGFELSITNNSSSVQQWSFPSSLTFDLILKNAAGDVVWQLTGHNGGLAVVTYVTLEPNETHVERFDWNQIIDDSSGAYLPTGMYAMEGYYTMLFGQKSDIATVDITII